MENALRSLITITLLYELGGEGFVTTIEDSNMRRCFCKANMVRYIDIIRETMRVVPIKERKIYYIKIKIVSDTANFQGVQKYCITQTRPCNIQQYFKAVKMFIFR